MRELFFTILGGVITAVIVGWLGLGKSKTVVIQGVKVKKTGKWMIIVSVVMILFGLFIASKGESMIPVGWGIVFYGFILSFIGGIVAWFQRL